MASPRSPHVLLITAPLQGHVNPLLVLGRRLASTGLLVTFSTVPVAGLKLIHAQDGTSLSIGPGTLRFDHLRGCGLWAPDDPRYHAGSSDAMIRHLEDAAPAAVDALVRRQSDAGRPVTFAVVNAFAPWARRAVVSGDLLGVPNAVLWTESCAVLSLYYKHFHSLAAFPSPEAGPTAPVRVPGLPPLASGDLPHLIHAPEQFFWRQMLAADLRGIRETAAWVLVNTFDELEHETIDELRVHVPVPVVPVGPLADHEQSHGCQDGDDGVAAWLDAQPPRSVVFVAFGSIVKISRDEAAELSAGLAATGRPFLLVVRDDNRDTLTEDCLAPVTAAGSGGSNKVVAWCEQGRVLAHRAVGCFVTHCGWNSTIEALAAGVPVIAYPAWADQPTNAKFLTDVYGVGVRLPRPMAGEALRRCVEEVMSGPEAEAMREKAGKWKAKASASLADGGSSDKGIQDFVDAVTAIQGN